MWRASLEHGVGVTDPHPIEEQIQYFKTKVQPAHRVLVARQDHALVGFLASNADSVAQLYVRVENFGQGIGSRLIDLAKEGSAGSLWLFTFARNLRARRFYERHGFKAVAQGFEPMWQLEDIKYEWRRANSAA